MFLCDLYWQKPENRKYFDENYNLKPDAPKDVVDSFSDIVSNVKNVKKGLKNMKRN